MSDFDKEAEREKLREKYEREEKKREATERMSELLLKGATMTNAHCSDCGDPIFRYDGQEFCPTCEKPVDRGGGENAGVDEGVGDGNEGGDGDESDGDESDDADANGDAAAGSERIEVTTPSDDARVRFGGDEDAAEDAADPEAPRPEAPSDEPSDDEPSAGESQQEATTTKDAGADRRSRPDTARPAGDATADVSAARTALARATRTYAERALDSDGPRAAKEHLEAAREAAEALAALEGR